MQPSVGTWLVLHADAAPACPTWHGLVLHSPSFRPQQHDDADLKTQLPDKRPRFLVVIGAVMSPSSLKASGFFTVPQLL